MKKDFSDVYKNIPVTKVTFEIVKDTWAESQKRKEEKQLKEINKIIKDKSKEKQVVKSKFKEATEKLKEKQELQSRISKLYASWISVMANKEIHNKLNQTFTIRHIEEKEYGWSFRVYSPNGRALAELETCKPYIETGLKCIFQYKVPEHRQFAMAKIIYPNQIKCNEIPFTPFKVRPYQLAMGVTVGGDPVIFDVNKQAMAFIAGQTRKGKNGSVDTAITSLIWSCSEKEVELFLFQCAKNDFIKYRKCKQVRSFVMGDLKKMAIAIEYVFKEMKRREILLSPMTESLEGDNLFDYNKLNPNNQLSYIYVIFDEFIELIPDETDSKEIKALKNTILRYLRSISQWGASYGINYVILHQKPEAKLCPTFLKNNSTIRVCFSFTDPVCSEIVLGNRMAVGMPPRRAIYINDNSEFDMLFTTNLRYENGKSRIKEFIKDSIEQNHKTIFDELGIDDVKEDTIGKSSIKELSKEKSQQQASGKVKINNENKKLENKTEEQQTIEQPKLSEFIQLNFFNVDPDVTKEREEKLKENISKIPGFVPFNPNKSPKVNVIDETDLAFRKSEKPISQGKVKINETISSGQR